MQIKIKVTIIAAIRDCKTTPIATVVETLSEIPCASNTNKHNECKLETLISTMNAST